MTDQPRVGWRPSRTGWIAGAMVLLGFGLLEVSWGFMALVAAGLFGPGLLREFGWLADKDEFQRQADHRAGYHAFLTTGIIAALFVGYFRSAGEHAIEGANELPTLFLALLCFVWLFSSLVSYWGSGKTASRILIGFGGAWLLFTIVSNTGREWSGWTALLLHPLLTLPFFGLAWLARRWPRVTGLLLLGVAVFFFQFFGMFRRANFRLIDEGVTFLLFLGPLIASGLALLAGGRSSDLED